MNNNFTSDEKLVQFIDGETTAEEAAEIEQALTTNDTLRQQLQNLLLARDAVKNYGINNRVAGIRHAMLRSLPAAVTKTAPVKTMYKKIMRVAAGIILIAGLFGIYQYTTVSANKLYNSQYNEYTAGIYRGADAGAPLEKAYAEKNYAQVTALYEQLPNATVKETFLTAQAFLIKEDYPAAMKLFEAVMKKNKIAGTGLFEDDATYYLALTYLKLNRPADALQLFKKIHGNKNHLYNSKVSSWFLKKLQLLVWKQ
jgi:tetratricopeptide (TPR) repeat protein